MQFNGYQLGREGVLKVQITENPLGGLQRFFVGLLVATLSLSVSACEKTAVAATDATIEPAHAAAASAASFSARVVGVTDGDTITVLDEHNAQHTIRLANIDAPERGQPWGNRSKQTLSDMVFGAAITVQPTETDRYGRTIARLTVDGRDINRAMIASGAAWAYRQYLTDPSFIDAETNARRARLGLWSMPSHQTVAPWDWRRGSRSPEPLAELSGSSPLPPPRLLRGSDTSISAMQGAACGSKRYCREMSSCEEARFYLSQCGLQTLDGDGDGRPCEQVCGH